MTDLSFLLEFIDPIILGICLALGFALKNAFEKFPNRFIPLSALCIGTVLAIVLNFQNGITAEVILGGMISGLASTGLYELFRNLIHKKEE
jgi:MFS superfamily sulfate permease-like transporter